MENKIIAIDFDGTIFETEYPAILRPIRPVIELAKTMRESGAKLILWTCREGEELDAAVEACRAEGLEFDAVNDNLPEMKEKWGNNPRKVAADEYWDDRAWDATGSCEILARAIEKAMIYGTGVKISVGKIDPNGLVNFETKEDGYD